MADSENVRILDDINAAHWSFKANTDAVHPAASVHRDEPTLPAIPSTRRSGEMRAAAAEPFAWAGEGVYRQRCGRGVYVKEITDPRRLEGGFAYIDSEGTRYMPSGAYLSGGETHLTDLVGTRLVIAYDAPEGMRT